MGIVNRAGALADRVTMMALARADTDKGRREPMGPERLGFIRAAQFSAVLSLAPMMMLANMANAVALIVLEHRNETLTSATLVWALVVWIVAVNGVLSARRFAAAPRRTVASVRAPGRILLSSVLLGLLWCYPVIWLMPSGSPLEIAFISALTAGMVAGGSIALYPVPLAAIAFVLLLVTASLPAVMLSALPQKAPFLIVIAAFLCVVVQAILRHTGLFLSELRGRLDAEQRQDVVNMLMRAHASEGGHALWRADATLRILGDAAPLAAILKLPAHAPSSRLSDLLGAAGCSVRGDRDPSGTGVLEDAAPTPDVFDLTLDAANGDVLRLVGQRAASDGAAPSGFHGWITDVTAQTRAQERVYWLATHDKTTGLLNHGAFLDAARRACRAQAALGAGAALMLFVDADNLKGVNDSYGHAVGDLLIEEIAHKLRDSVPPGGLIARKSGDEFLTLIMAQTTADCRAIAQDITRALNACSGANGSDLPLSCSVGASIAARKDADPDRMELEADRALYRAKAGGGCRLSFHDHAAGEQLRRTRMMAHGIATAIAEEQLSLVFQPIWRLTCGEPEPVGAEALVRWRHPQFGEIPATSIVSLAADAGCNDALTSFVLRKATAAARSWPSDTLVSVNLSAGCLHRHAFAKETLRTLKAEQVSPRRLWLEITETEQRRDSPAMQRNIAALRAAGVSIVIDDFGAGYSTLAMLDIAPVDVIKIDKSLVRDCPDRKSSAIVFATLVQLASAHRCRIVAEGVETTPEVGAVQAAGIELAQGNVLSPPVDLLAVTTLLTGRRLLQKTG